MFLKPSLIIPGDVTQINLDALSSYGICGLIFDLDNTLIAPHTAELWPSVSEWLMQMREKQFKSVVVSNNHRPDYCKRCEDILQIPVIPQAKKPSPEKLIEAMQMMSLTAPNEVAVIGDRPLTDIWSGQRLGAMTVLVDPLIKAQEKPIIQFLRKLERLSIQN